MANVDRPNGFKFVKTVSGAPVTSIMRKYRAADRSADSTNNHGDIYIGDPVTLSTAGALTVANSGVGVLGVAVGAAPASSVEHGATGPYNPDNLEQRYAPLAVTSDVWVIPANDAVFEVQTDADLDLSPGELADTNIAAATAHGSQTTGYSSAELVAASNNDVIVIEDEERPDNDTSLANARHFVMFRNIINSVT